MVGLDVFSVGSAFAAFTTLIGRFGATRASVTVYLVPVVAIELGVGASGEPIAAVSPSASPWSCSAPTSAGDVPRRLSGHRRTRRV